MIVDYDNNGKSETSFPDQPIMLKMNYVSSEKVLFTVEIDKELRKFFLPTKQFFCVIIESAKYFFKQISAFYSNDELYAFELEKIEKLKKRFK